MKPGPELDKMVADKIMGYPEKEIPHYSTEIAPAWKVVEFLLMKLNARIVLRTLDYPDRKDIKGYEVTLSGTYDVQSSALTAPHAICLAALTAVGVVV